MSGDPIVVVTSGFPRVSETFALSELLALDAQGLLGAVFATKPGDAAPVQPGVARLSCPVQVLPPGDPARQAAVMLRRLGGRRVGGFYGYFAHQPAAVAAAAAAATGGRFGFGVHALDARKVLRPELAARARAARVVVACNQDVAEPVRQPGVVLRLIPHGVDLDRFHPQPSPPGGDMLRVLAVGRLVAKKGLDVLVEAVRRLPFPFDLRIVGAGPERQRLEAAVQARGLASRVRLTGPVTHDQLPACYAEADVVVVPSVVDAAGDRDGLPNVVLEAMASGRPVVASDVAAISTAVADRRSGLLVPPGDPDALAAAISELAAAACLRVALGSAGRRRVERDFELGRCTRRLGRALEEAYG
jgi:glycosyltransferase involved in cell wall biosynthesis